MPTTEPFDRLTQQYEAWFEANEAAYQSEIDALESLRPDPGFGVEIGVGSARFAEPLDIAVGVDPSGPMLDIARDRGITGIKGVAEALPFADETFDTALLVTTICFVDDLAATFSEAHRVLDADGALVIGYIDEDSPVGQQYKEMKAENPFYKDARFHTTDDVLSELEAAGFSATETVQTIFGWPGDLEEPEHVEPGYGEGSFVGIKATL
jgi:SAM-dependent methyltransferase